MDEWVTALGLRREDDGRHPPQRSSGPRHSIIYEAIGNLRAVQILLGEHERSTALAEGTEV